MVYTRGSIREKLLSQQGIRFDPSIMYMLANDHNHEEEKIVDRGEADEEAGRFDENEETGRFDEKEKESRNKRRDMTKDRDTFSIYNMKADDSSWLCL